MYAKSISHQLDGARKQKAKVQQENASPFCKKLMFYSSGCLKKMYKPPEPSSPTRKLNVRVGPCHQRVG